MTVTSRLRPALLAALALPGCVYVDRPSYDPSAHAVPGYAAPIGPNAGAGAAVGALAGGLIGGAASGRHDRGVGIVGGAAAGALLGGLIGSGIDRDNAAAQAPPAYPAPGHDQPPPYYQQPYAQPEPEYQAPAAPYGPPKTWPDEPPAYRGW